MCGTHALALGPLRSSRETHTRTRNALFVKRIFHFKTGKRKQMHLRDLNTGLTLRHVHGNTRERIWEQFRVAVGGSLGT